jgi:hypothetical protein
MIKKSPKRNNTAYEKRLARVETTLAVHTHTWFYVGRDALDRLKRRYKDKDLEPQKKKAILDALEEASRALASEPIDKEALVKAGKKLANTLKNGNGGGSCEELCGVWFGLCLERGGDPALCVVGLFICLLACDVAEAKTTSIPDGFLPFKGCRGFYENKSDQPQTITITIYNPGPGRMEIRLQKPDGVLDGNLITTVEEGEYKTITVTVPANRRLHGQIDGKRKLDKP